MLRKPPSVIGFLHFQQGPGFAIGGADLTPKFSQNVLNIITVELQTDNKARIQAGCVRPIITFRKLILFVRLWTVYTKRCNTTNCS